MIMQTLALFLDAYRELNAKKLFWIVMMLSGLFIAVFACLGNNAEGITILWWTIPVEMMSTAVIPKATFYKIMFISLGFQIWLTWAATILALVSTAGIIPDFVSGGAIELTLSKPIGRARLFLTKYLTGLLFVGLQVSVFSVLAFVVIGIRGDAWLPAILSAIPLVVLFYSYLFCITTLVGLLTRSTITALLTTLLVWLLIFLVHLAETGIILQIKITYDQRVAIRPAKIEEVRADIEEVRRILADERAKAGVSDASAAPAVGEQPAAAELPGSVIAAEARLGRLEERLATHEREQAKDEKTRSKLASAHAILFGVKTVLPKTSETMELLNRWLISGAEMEGLLNQTPNEDVRFGEDSDVRVSQRTIQRKVQREIESRTIGWVIGTSVLFELVVLGGCCWIFCRRDF